MGDITELMQRNNLFKYCLWCFIWSFNVLYGNSQATIADRNVSYIDSVTQDLRTYYCNNILTYPPSLNARKAKKEIYIIDFLNKIFRRQFTDVEFESDIQKFKKTRVYKSVRQNGLIKSYNIVLNGKYLRVELSVNFVGGFVFGKKCTINTISHARCGESAIRFVDFTLLKEIYLSAIDFPIFLFDNVVAAEKSDVEGIKSAAMANNTYIFSLPKDGDTGAISKILEKQFSQDEPCCYSYKTPPADFVTLIIRGEYDLIRNLLFSPNYFYAINAMEALIYLNSVGKIKIDDKAAERIGLIREQVFAINTQTSFDVFPVVQGYKGLHTNELKVILKYADYFDKQNGK